MRDDDSDIDALLRGASLPCAASQPASAPLARGKSRARRAVVAPPPSQSETVDALSQQLVVELDRNAAAEPPEMIADEYAAIVADHLAPSPGFTGLVDVSPDDYHDLPGFSSSIAKTVIGQSPAHARAQHARFNGRGKAPTRALDRGAVVHALVLGAGKRFAVLNFGDYKTNAAKEQRDAARDSGMIPILRHEMLAAEAIARNLTRELAARGFTLDGSSEVAMQWWEETEHGFVRCRCMFDHLYATGVILDLKIAHDATPDGVERAAENFGYALQSAAYRRGLSRLRPELVGRARFVFAFAEPERPHAVNLCEGDGVFREVGERRWERAVAIWARCLATNTWPAFGAGINPISVPVWALRKEGLLQ